MKTFFYAIGVVTSSLMVCLVTFVSPTAFSNGWINRVTLVNVQRDSAGLETMTLKSTNFANEQVRLIAAFKLFLKETFPNTNYEKTMGYTVNEQSLSFTNPSTGQIEVFTGR